MSYEEGDEIYSPYPVNYANTIKMTTPAYAVVERVDSPNPDGKVTARCDALWGPSGNWLGSLVYNGGSDLGEEGGNTGDWTPFQPGQIVIASAPGGNPNKFILSSGCAKSFREEV